MSVKTITGMSKVLPLVISSVTSEINAVKNCHISKLEVVESVRPFIKMETEGRWFQ